MKRVKKFIFFVSVVFCLLIALSLSSGLKQNLMLALSSDASKPLSKNLKLLIRLDEKSSIEEFAISVQERPATEKSLEGEYLVVARSMDNKTLWQTRTQLTAPTEDSDRQGRPYLINVVVPLTPNLYKIEFFLASVGNQQVKLGQYIVSDNLSNWFKILMLAID